MDSMVAKDGERENLGMVGHPRKNHRALNLEVILLRSRDGSEELRMESEYSGVLWKIDVMNEEKRYGLLSLVCSGTSMIKK